MTAATAAAVAEDNLASGTEFAMTAADKFVGEDTQAVVTADEAKSADQKPEAKKGHRGAVAGATAPRTKVTGCRQCRIRSTILVPSGI